MRYLAFLIAVLLIAGCSTTQEKEYQQQRDANTAALNVSAGEDLLKHGQPEQALRKVTQAIELDPNLPEAYDLAARIYDNSHQPGLAEKYYKRAIDLKPDNYPVLVHYGTHLCKDQRYDEAEKTLLQAAQTKDENLRAIAYANAGLCTLRIPDPDRAAQYFRAAIDSDPTVAAPHYQLARINYDKQRYPQAARSLHSYLRLAEPTAKVLLLGAQIARALGDRGQFNQYADMLNKRFPNSPEAATVRKLAAARWAGGPAQATTTTIRGTTAQSSGSTEMGRELWIMTREPQHYTIRLLTSQNEQAMDYVRQTFRLPGPIAYYTESRGGTSRHVLLYGDYATRNTAQQALDSLPGRLRGDNPELRQFAAIQKAIRATR